GYYEQTVAGTSPSGTEWTRDSHDLAGRVVRSARNGAGFSTRHYDARGRLVKEVDPDGVSVRFAYHPDGTLHRRYLDLNRNDALDSGDPLAEFEESYLEAHGETVLRRETRVYD